MVVKVKFQSETEVKEGKSLLKAAKDAKIKIKDSCDGKGKCGKCEVKVISGKLSEPTDKEIKELGEESIKEGHRLACQAFVVDAEVIVEVVK
jgi:ferredoxin